MDGSTNIGDVGNGQLSCKQSHTALLREEITKSLVLLKNSELDFNPLLPLAKNANNILIVGAQANDVGLQCGG